jgi:hypothetical protein
MAPGVMFEFRPSGTLNVLDFSIGVRWILAVSPNDLRASSRCARE